MTRLLIFLLFMVCGTGLFYLVFVHELPRSDEETVLPQLTSDISMQKVHVKQNHGDNLEWEAFADTATYSEANRQAWLTAVRFQILRTKGDPADPTDIHGVANTAFVDDVRKRVLLQGKVRIVKDEDTEVRADVIDYYTEEGLVKARGNVEVRDKKAFLQGETLTYHIDSDRAVISAPKLFQ